MTTTLWETCWYSALLFFALVLFLTLIGIVSCRIYFYRRAPRERRPTVIAFFHPHCAAGGGGERVLWKAIQVLGDLNEQGLPLEIIIYTIDVPKDHYKETVLQHVQARFSIELSPKLSLSFVHLNRHAHFLDRCRRFSLVGESIGTMRLAFRALQAATPHVFFDTTGCAFTFFVARVLAGCQVAAYVHYPTISTDMLAMVWERRPSYNHNADITKSFSTTLIKLVYYTLFAVAYGMVGSLASLVMVNSSWTYGHISFLWRGAGRRRKVVFPPCDVSALQSLPTAHRERVILSIGQFRPEKDHELQIRSFARLRESHSSMRDVRLVLLGSCRGTADEDRVKEYRDLVESLHLTKSVEFVLNQPYSVVQSWLGRASVGIHTMWNEHFGIGVVEMMGAGLLVVAHNSGGPKADIVVPYQGQPTGYLASTEAEYADSMFQALSMVEPQAVSMRERARSSALRFSDEVFSKSFGSAIIESKLLR